MKCLLRIAAACLVVLLIASSAGAQMQPAGVGKIVRTEAALDKLIPSGAQIEKLAGGFGFTEGPVWTRDGALLFSDIPNNVIHRWTPDGTVTVFRKPSGYDRNDPPPGAFVGSNGLTLDKAGRLVICEHGNRRVTRLEPDGKLTVLADQFEGKRLNSPNDAVYKSDGALYFTDPRYGPVTGDADPQKELTFSGIYRLAGGKLQLLHSEMTRPNGLAFSPDENYLYVSDSKRAVWMRFEVRRDGTIANGKVFVDPTGRGDGAPDGLKVDRSGNLYATGPGGVWIISPAGKQLGLIVPPERPANLHWGDNDARTLYMTARTGLYRIRLNATGIRP